MAIWHPAEGYTAPSGVAARSIIGDELKQRREWQEWFEEHYPDYKLLSFKVLGVRPMMINSPEPRVIEWGIRVQAPDGTIKGFAHGEEVGDDGRGGLQTEGAVYDHMLDSMGMGPYEETVAQDMADEFGVDPKQVA